MISPFCVLRSEVEPLATEVNLRNPNMETSLTRSLYLFSNIKLPLRVGVNLRPGREGAALSHPDYVCIIPSEDILRKLGKISNTSLITVAPIFPVRRKVVQPFLASVSYFQRPSRRGAGGTKKRKIGTKERRQRKTTCQTASHRPSEQSQGSLEVAQQLPL